MTITGVKACPRCTGFVAHVDDEYLCLSCGHRVAYDPMPKVVLGFRHRKGAGNGRLGYA